MREHVAALEARKAELQDQLMDATDEKNGCSQAAAATAKRLNLAERLVNGLKDEGVRWGASVEALEEQMRLLVGRRHGSAAFIAYIGPFNEELPRAAACNELGARPRRALHPAPTRGSTRSRCSPTTRRSRRGSRRACPPTGCRWRTPPSSTRARAGRC